jgi:hypothetical protein
MREENPRIRECDDEGFVHYGDVNGEGDVLSLLANSISDTDDMARYYVTLEQFLRQDQTNRIETF